MKKRNILTSAIILFISFPILGQNIESIFINMPNTIFPPLTSKQRMEMLEYYKSNLNDTTENILGGESYILSFDAEKNHLKIQSTANATFEMLYIEGTDDINYLATIRTVCAPICSSVITYYDSTWNVVPLKHIAPKATDWILKDEVEKTDYTFEEYSQLLPVSFISYSFDTGKQSIEATNNSLLYLDETERKKLTPVMNKYTISYPVLSFINNEK